ncbi:Crp/Fnr family transcriptional regulator [Flavobacterium sp. U410]|jgi:CRP-like cAMP-binding protein
MSLILDNIGKHITLTEEEKALFLSKTKIIKAKAKTMLLNAGEISQYTYFVNEGILRSFTINDNIVEHILSFACADWWMGDMYSLISKKPGHLFIEVIEDSELVLLSREDQEELFHKIPKLERFFRILIENSLVAHQERLMDNLSLTAEERYEKFQQKYPSLIASIPQKYIAAYIGVTPEFFSKMKAKLLRNSSN